MAVQIRLLLVKRKMTAEKFMLLVGYFLCIFAVKKYRKFNYSLNNDIEFFCLSKRKNKNKWERFRIKTNDQSLECDISPLNESILETIF